MNHYVAIDQYGYHVSYHSKTPRAGLLKALGSKDCSEMYRDDPVTGKTFHIGYVVGSRWFAIAQYIERPA